MNILNLIVYIYHSKILPTIHHLFSRIQINSVFALHVQLSALSGIGATIFAYGQTSNGNSKLVA
jgi:hypothetical protein